MLNSGATATAAKAKTELRRRVARVPVGWKGLWRVEDYLNADWHDCRVIDISALGVGLEVYGYVPYGIVGRRLMVDVDTQGRAASGNLSLLGEVRYTTTGPRHGTRMGLEFANSSENALHLLRVMERLQVAS